MKNLLYKFLSVTLLSSVLLGSSASAFSYTSQAKNNPALIAENQMNESHSSHTILRSQGCHYEPGGPEGEVCLFMKEDTQESGKLLFSVTRFTPLNDNTSIMDNYSDYLLYNRNLRSGGTESILKFTQSPDGHQTVNLSTLPCGINQIEAKLLSGESTGSTMYKKNC